MKTIKRREFLITAAGSCSLLAIGKGKWLRGGILQEATGIAVLKDKCDGCGDCVKVCPVDAISIEKEKAVLDNDLCIECDACIEECPTEALIYRKDLEKRKRDERDKEEPARKTGERTAVAFNISGLWVMTGTFSDGSPAVQEDVRFDGTSSEGVLITAATGDRQGAYKINGEAVEFRFDNGDMAKGKIVSADRMEGLLPQNLGRWRADRKRTAV
jgi:ferredoxin